MYKTMLFTTLAVGCLLAFCACGTQTAELGSESAQTAVDAVSTSATVQTAGRSQVQQGKEQIVSLMASYSAGCGDYDVTVAGSALIARVKALNGAQEERFNEPDVANGVKPDSYVLTPVRIEEVLKADGKHQAGDVINVEEYYATAPSPTDPTTKLVFVWGFYVPMKVGHEYILFLTAPQFAGDYQMTFGAWAKFAFNDKTKDADTGHKLSDQEWEVGGPDSPEAVPDLYFEMATKVMQKLAQ
jgi:hypothetical protein